MRRASEFNLPTKRVFPPLEWELFAYLFFEELTVAVVDECKGAKCWIDDSSKKVLVDPESGGIIPQAVPCVHGLPVLKGCLE
jgi:hypothetical protein